MKKNLGIKEIFLILKKRWLLILALTFTAGILGAAVTHYLITPQYGASTRILVNQPGGKSVYDSGAVSTNVQLVNTYSELINDPIVLNKVIQRLHLPMTADGLQGMLEENTSDNSQIFTISITSNNPEQSVRIVNEIATVFKMQVQKMMNLNNVSLLAPATLDQSQLLSPSLSKNITIAVALGLLLSVAFTFLLEYLDNSIKEEEDISERLGMPVIGVISHVPNFRQKWVENPTHPSHPSLKTANERGQAL